METYTLADQQKVLVEQESSEQVFWCELVDLADGDEKSFDEGMQCGCGSCT